MVGKVVASILVFLIILISVVGLVNIDWAIKIAVDAIVVAMFIGVLITVTRMFTK